MGTADRVIRIVTAAIALNLYGFGVINGTLANALLVISGIFILTSLFSFCPLYLPFGINTGASTN